MDAEQQTRTLAQIDHELEIERRLLRLEYPRRDGDNGSDLARRNIDRLLDERMVVQRMLASELLPGVQGTPPRRRHGRVVPRP